MHSGHTHSVLRTESAQGRPGQCSWHPNAARAQPAARLLDKLHTLLLQRRGRALLGCRLRLGARVPHLGDGFLIVQAWRIMGKTMLHNQAELRHHMPCAATCMAFMAVP